VAGKSVSPPARRDPLQPHLYLIRGRVWHRIDSVAHPEFHPALSRSTRFYDGDDQCLWGLLYHCSISGSERLFIGSWPEENVTSPRTAIRYIQFFVWYQMISGLAQVTFIAWWVFAMVPRTELAYAMWFFLIYSTVQYPGMLGIFRGTLEAYQRYHKASLIQFIQTQIFENVMRIIFILIGRWVGAQNPAVGEIVGATAGALIALTFGTSSRPGLGAHWCAPVLRSVDPDLKVRDLFHVEFDRVVVKKKPFVWPPGNGAGTDQSRGVMISTYMIVAWMPGMRSVLGMYAMGKCWRHGDDLRI